MQRGTGPLIRPASRRRPTRQQIARRRAFVVFLVVLLAFSVWRFWPASSGARTAGQSPGQSPSGSGPTPTTIVPGKNPIKHVIFMVKENRTFDHYFGLYPGADGATVGRRSTAARRTDACPAPTTR